LRFQGEVLADGAGLSVPEVCRRARVSYRRLDYWDRIGLVKPSVRPATGSGTQRLYSERDVAMLSSIRYLLEAGLTLTWIRTAIAGGRLAAEVRGLGERLRGVAEAIDRAETMARHPAAQAGGR
jgi:DNA-binding transcriptional MerR regulator